MVQPFALGSSLANVAANSFDYRGRKEAGREHSVAFQPKPAFFAPIWYTIFSGLVTFSFTRQARDKKAKRWHLIANSFGTAALSYKLRNPAVDIGVNGALLVSAVQYRRALEAQGEATRAEHFVRYTAELFAGWMSAAFLLTIVQSAQRVLGNPAQSKAETAIGVASVGALTGAGIGVCRATGWIGYGGAVSWALTGAAIRRENPTWVRVAAGVGALAVGAHSIQHFLQMRAEKVDDIPMVTVVEFEEILLH